MEEATFAAGCFWGVELAYQKLKGVSDTKVGYTHGQTENPTYENVCTGQTGHAEAVWVEFDPAVISYNELLDVFWSKHDPTQVNRQGPDIGTQYRSGIYFHNEEQHQQAIQSRDALDKSGRHSFPIATEIKPATVFYPAEDYHQRYLEKRGMTHCG